MPRPSTLPPPPAPCARPLAEFDALKKRRKYRFLVLKADPETFELSVEARGPPTATPADLLKALPRVQCRFAVYDHEFRTKDGRIKNDLYVIAWTPGTAAAHQKVFYASQRLHVSGSLAGTRELRAANDAEILSVLSIKVEGEKPAGGAAGGGSGGADDDDDDEHWDPDA